MYINFEVLEKSRVDHLEFFCLVALKQKQEKELGEYLGFYVGDIFENLKEKGLVAKLKSKEGYKLLPKGTSVLNLVEIAEVTEDSKRGYVALMELYESVGRKDRLGKNSRGLKYFSQFLAQTEFSLEFILKVVENYLSSQEHKYTKHLDRLIFEPQNIYSTRFDLEYCKLYELCKRYQ